MGQKFSNAARSELEAAISSADTSFNVLSNGDKFPDASIASGNWFKAVLQDDTGIEIIHVRTHSLTTTPNSFTDVLRGQEGTTARAFGLKTVVGLRLTAADLTALQTSIEGKEPAITKSLGSLRWDGSKWVWDNQSYMPTSHPANNITGTSVNNWNTAFGWGNHASANYLKPSNIGSSVQGYSLNLTNWGNKGVPAGNIVDDSTSQTLSNKTLNSPAINTPSVNNYLRFNSEHNHGTVATTATTIDFTNGQKQRVTLSSNTTISFTFPGVGNYQLIVIQDGTGNRTFTFNGASYFLGKASESALDKNLTANGRTLVSLFWDGSAITLGSVKLNA